MSGEVWEEVYDRLAELILAHRTTLIFVNTRRMAERATRAPVRAASARTRLPRITAASPRSSRLDAEQRLKGGELKALVATASLELGIDIGEVDLVCQLGSPRSIAAFLQRVGRSGHAVDGTPKGRLFPLSRDELVECAALLDSVAPRRARPHLDPRTAARRAGAADRRRSRGAGMERGRALRAVPPRLALSRTAARGFRRDRADAGGGLQHPARPARRADPSRRGQPHAARPARRAADGADLRRRDPRQRRLPGGAGAGEPVHRHASTRISPSRAWPATSSSSATPPTASARVERGTVRVEDAQGQPPNIPFWLGEAPGRSDELSQAVSRLRAEIAAALSTRPIRSGDGHSARLADRASSASARPAARAARRLSGGRRMPRSASCRPRRRIVFERFFDEVGGMQLVIHSPYGSRINRAWGLALRKRFCRKFNFELQAAATEDNIVLSLTTAHSFELAEVARYLHSATRARAAGPGAARRADVHRRAGAGSPAWRWRCRASAAARRCRRSSCAWTPRTWSPRSSPTSSPAPRTWPASARSPTIRWSDQTIGDCLHEAMDIDGLERLLGRIEAGEIRVVARDLTEPSPLALEVLSARPYAFLDDAPLEERRTQAVMGRRWLAPEDAADLGRLDAEAIARVREEAWPEAGQRRRTARRAGLARLPEPTAERRRGWADGSPNWLGTRDVAAEPTRSGRSRRPLTGANGPGLRGTHPSELWVAAERLPQFLALWPEARLDPPIAAPASLCRNATGRARGGAGRDPARPAGRAGTGDRSRAGGAARASSPPTSPRRWPRCEAEGFALRGRFTPGRPTTNGASAGCSPASTATRCRRLRAEIEPVAARDFLRFLFDWQRVHRRDAHGRARRARRRWSASSKASRRRPAPGRPRSCRRASPNTSRPGSTTNASPAASPGRGCGRATRGRSGERGAAPVRTTPITLLARRHAPLWAALSPVPDAAAGRARAARPSPSFIREHGASFFDELVDGTRPAAPAGRGGAGRAGRAGPGQLRQLRRPARAAGAVRPAPALAGGGGAAT